MNKEHTIKTYRELSKIPYGHADKSITPGCIVVEGGAFRGLYNQGVLNRPDSLRSYLKESSPAGEHEKDI